MKSKKFIFLFLGLLLLLTLSGCNDIFKSYSITYYVDGDKVSLEPAYYFPGREVKLPTSEDLPAIPNLEFSGWYDNAEYEGEIITVIAAAEASDKVFYGKYSSTGTVDPEQPGNPDPEQPEQPDTPVDPEEPNQPLSSSIKDVYSKTVGDKVTVEGIITGIYGNNFYINDGVKGILVYLGNETKYASTVKLGANVVVEGSVDIYKDIHQIKTITSLNVSNKTYKATSIKLTNVSQDELKKYPNDLVNLEGVSVSDLGTYESGKDYTVKLTLNGVTVDLFMSRHVAESAKTKVLEVLESLADTDTLNINGLHVSKHNSYQLVITDATSLVKVASSTPDTPVAPEQPEQPDTPVDPEIDLEEVFNQTSYKYELTYLYGNEYAEEIYRVNNGKYHFYSEGYYEMYYGLLNSLNHVFYDNEGAWEYLTEEDTDYEYVAMGLFYVDLRLVDTTKLIKQNDYYTCASSYLNELGLILAGYEEDYDSIKIYISNGYVNKIELHSSYEYDGITEECEYEILISNYGKEVVIFPENAIHAGLGGGGEEEPSNPSGTTIGDVYELSAGTTVTVTGAITGIYGNNFFINDGTKGLLVYMGSETSFNDIIELDNVVTVTGEVSIYKGAHQLQNVSSISLENKTIEVEAEVLEDVEQTTLEKNINDLVNVYNLKVETLSTVNLSKDYSFKCSLDGVEVNVFVSRHNSSTFKDALEGYLENVQVGDIITILNAHVSSHNAYQLVLTDPASIVAAPEVVEAIKITCTPSTLNITSNSSLEDVLNELTLHLVYNNGTKTQLTENDFTVDSANYNGTVGTYEFTFTYNDFQTICTVVVREPGSGSFRVNLDHSPILDVKDDMCYDPETNETYGVTQGLPSVGNPKVLVIPVEFNDSPAPSSMVEDLEKAFFGTSEETGWESLKSYYYKSSYGKLTIDGTVLEPFNTGKNVGYYDNLYAQYLEDLDAYYNYETETYPDNVEYSIIKSALEYYDDQINYDDYDTDNDGYIDSIYLIYSCSYSYDDDSFWWAYTTQYYTTEYEYYDSVEADFYCFMSYEFLFDDFYGNNVTYNTETIIHETGHLLGLDDYYDYEEGNGPDGGIGGGDMMDYNVGDHNAYSKMMLGWISPIVMTDTDTITLSSFASSGDAIFIFKDYNGSFFSEYYVIDFYTPDGLNEAQKGNSGLFDAAGIRIYHVDATLNTKEECYSIYELTKFNNTDTDHKLISLVEADGRGDILNSGSSSASDLFTAGKTYSGSKWYSGEATGFTITVDSMSASQATITITLN